MKINVYPNANTPISENDEKVPGLYKVTFDFDPTGLTRPKLAAIALNIFHTNTAIHALDTFHYDVLDDDNRPVPRETSLEALPPFSQGSVEQLDNIPW